jgi:hypothetical protein
MVASLAEQVIRAWIPKPQIITRRLACTRTTTQSVRSVMPAAAADDHAWISAAARWAMSLRYQAPRKDTRDAAA